MHNVNHGIELSCDRQYPRERRKRSRRKIGSDQNILQRDFNGSCKLWWQDASFFEPVFALAGSQCAPSLAKNTMASNPQRSADALAIPDAYGPQLHQFHFSNQQVTQAPSLTYGFDRLGRFATMTEYGRRMPRPQT
jgi:hypothetical protein